MPTRGLDLREIRQTVLLKLEDLSFIAINIKGSKAYVEVTEATGKPEMVDTDTPCNLIATKAGVIVRTEITQGFGLVRAGDAVEAGDMLVSGMVFSDKGRLSPRPFFRQDLCENGLSARIRGTVCADRARTHRRRVHASKAAAV